MAASARADPDEAQPPREQPHRERRNRIAATFATADMVGNSPSPMWQIPARSSGFAFGDPRRHEYGRFAPSRPFDQAGWGMESRHHQSPRIDCGSIAEGSRRDAGGPFPGRVSDAGPAQAVVPVRWPAYESHRRTNPRESDEELAVYGDLARQRVCRGVILLGLLGAESR